MTFGRKNAEVAEGVSIVSDSLLVTAIAFCVYAANTFFWRRRGLRRKVGCMLVHFACPCDASSCRSGRSGKKRQCMPRGTLLTSCNQRTIPICTMSLGAPQFLAASFFLPLPPSLPRCVCACVCVCARARIRVREFSRSNPRFVELLRSSLLSLCVTRVCTGSC